MSKIIGSVEIGTSHAKALVGEVGESVNIVGMSTRPNEGMRKGEIVDFRKVATSVHAAIADAEKMSGTTVDSVYLAQSGSHLKGRMLQGSSYVSSSDNRVTSHDLERASEEAQRRQAEEGRNYVHFVRLRFFWTVRYEMIRLECMEKKSILAIGRLMEKSKLCAPQFM